MREAYRSSKQTIFNEMWMTKSQQHADAEYQYEQQTIIDRAKDLCRNNPVAASIMTTLIDYVASTGLTPLSENTDMLKIWNEWAQDCHISGSYNFEQVYRDIVGAEVESGDVMVYTPINKNAKGLKMRLDLIEGDKIRTPVKFSSGKDPSGRHLRNGVAYDSAGYELGYWVAKIDPRTSSYMEGDESKYYYFDRYVNGRFNCQLVRRPDKLRPGMSRQMPLFVTIVQAIRDIDELFDASIKRSKALSLINLVIETMEPSTINTAFGKDDTSTEEEALMSTGQPYIVGNLDSGSIIKVPFGSKPSTITPSGQMDIDVLIVRAIRLVGAAMGVPYELISRDFSETNFASGKLAHDGFFRMVDRWNRGNASQICNRLFRNLMLEAYFSGQIKEISEESVNVQWIGGPSSYNANPLQESKAEETRLNNNVITEEILAARQGMKIEDIYRGKAKEYKLQREIEQEYGLPEGMLARKTKEADITNEDMEDEDVPKD